MTLAEHETLVKMLVNADTPERERINAARRLAECDAPEALDALWQVAGEDDGQLGWVAGESIATVVIRQGTSYNVPLWAFTMSSGEAFDLAMARYQYAHRAHRNLDPAKGPANSEQPQDDIADVTDARLPVLDRVIAARRLGLYDSRDGLHALLGIALDPREDEWLCYAAGESIAEMLLPRAAVTEAPLRDFTVPARLGFEEVVARTERQSTSLAPAPR
jgi:hypothetical protein